MKLFVGFDMHNSNIKIMNADKLHAAAGAEYLHFNERIFTKEFFAEAAELLSDYFTRKPTLRNLQAYVILPDEAVGLETFNIPNMNRTRMAQALEAELNNLYEGRQKSRKINKFLLKRGKQYSTFGAIYFDKDLVAEIYKLLTRVKVFPCATTYSGNALINSAFAYMPRTRGKSFLFADIHLDHTEIALASKGRNARLCLFAARHGASENGQGGTGIHVHRSRGGRACGHQRARDGAREGAHPLRGGCVRRDPRRRHH